MGIIKTTDYEGNDRRVNGARIKLDVADWIKISITIFTSFAIITFGAGKLMTIVNAHTEELIKFQEKCKMIDSHEVRVSILETSIGYIKAGVDSLNFKIDKLTNTK